MGQAPPSAIRYKATQEEASQTKSSSEPAPHCASSQAQLCGKEEQSPLSKAQQILTLPNSVGNSFPARSAGCQLPTQSGALSAGEICELSCMERSQSAYDTNTSNLVLY